MPQCACASEVYGVCLCLSAHAQARYTVCVCVDCYSYSRINELQVSSISGFAKYCFVLELCVYLSTECNYTLSLVLQVSSALAIGSCKR